MPQHTTQKERSTSTYVSGSRKLHMATCMSYVRHSVCCPCLLPSSGDAKALLESAGINAVATSTAVAEAAGSAAASVPYLTKAQMKLSQAKAMQSQDSNTFSKALKDAYIAGCQVRGPGESWDASWCALSGLPFL